MLLNYMEETGERIECLKSVIVAGSAVIERCECKYGVEAWQAWV